MSLSEFEIAHIRRKYNMTQKPNRQGSVSWICEFTDDLIDQVVEALLTQPNPTYKEQKKRWAFHPSTKSFDPQSIEAFDIASEPTAKPQQPHHRKHTANPFW